MKSSRFLIISFIAATTLASCEKQSRREVPDCLEDAPPVRTIIDQEAKVILEGTVFFIIEKNTIDTRLRPCNLPEEFQVNQLAVVISGLTKATIQQGICCTEDFTIDKISK